jgi:CysZ protein
MFTPLARALEQFDDPAILAVLIKSLLVSIACFAALVLGSIYGLHHLLAPQGWLAWLAGILGGAASLAAGVWLFLPVAVVIAWAFMEPVCRAVERRWYPGLPHPKGASLTLQIWDGIVVACLVLVLNLVSLVLALLIPGIGLLLGWAITAWALGRGLFVAVAMRRMSRSDAAHLYLRHRGGVLLQGAALALAASIPLLNLFLPVLGPACMVHVLMQRVPAA